MIAGNPPRGGISCDQIDHNDEEKKKHYISRHRVNENWADYKSAGSLSRYIVWNQPTLQASIKKYKDTFKLT